MRRQWWGGIGIGVMSGSTAVALSRLIAHGLRPGVIAPVVLAIVVADLGVIVVTRLRLPMIPAIVVGGLLAFLALLIGLDPTLVNPASSHFADLSLFSDQIHAARSALASDGTPLPPLTGVVVALGALGALAAAATRAIWENQLRRERWHGGHVGPLTGCIAPSLGVFVYSTLVSADQGRLAAALTYFIGVALFVALVDRVGAVSTSASTGRIAEPMLRRLSVSTAAGAALVLVVVVAASSGLSGMRLSVFHVTPPPAAAEALVTGTSLVDNLRAVEIQESNTVIFHATSALPTYWQVGTLNTFDGTEWVATPGVTAALAGSARAAANALGPSSVAPPVPTNGQAFTATVNISDFASRLLPSPPHTTSVSGVTASVVGQEGILAATTSSPQTSYNVTARLVPAKPDGAQLPLSDPRLAPYLALPDLPAVVPFLAHEVVGAATSEGTEVQDLINWFRSGRFTYTLNPPATTGSDPLVDFLTTTRAGYCQQFAGAFGILARSLGIPTRLVVGFTTGTPGAGTSYTVTGADAHVWPQVYLGPGTGWVSVEPTPPAGANSAVPANVVQPNTPTSTTVTTQHPGGGGNTGTTPGGVHGSHAGTKKDVHHHTGGTSVALVVALIVLGCLALAAAVWFVRRRRGLTVTGGSAEQRIVAAWERAQRSLARQGLGRRPAETPGEFALRVAHLEDGAPRSVGSAALTRLAALVELACYVPRPCSAGQAEAAASESEAVVAANRRRGVATAS